MSAVIPSRAVDSSNYPSDQDLNVGNCDKLFHTGSSSKYHFQGDRFIFMTYIIENLKSLHGTNDIV